MTKRFNAWDDWSVYAVGTNVAGHTARGPAASSWTPQYDTLYTPFKERYLKFLLNSTADYKAVSADAIDSDGNRATFSRVGALPFDLQTVEEVHIYGRGQGTNPMTDFIRARITMASGNVYIDKMVASAYTAGTGRAAGNVTLATGNAYLYRFEAQGSRARLKIWNANLGRAGEPDFAPYGYTPGIANNYFSTPDSAAASITGSIDIRVYVALASWNPAVFQTLVGKYSSPNASYLLGVEAGGTLRFFGSSDGTTNTDAGPNSTVSLSSIPDGALKWIRCTKNTATGDIKYYTSDDGVTWTQLGTTIAGAVYSIFDGTAALSIGQYAGGSGPANAQFYRAMIYNGIAGTLAVDFDPRRSANGWTNFTAVTGEVWSVNTSGGTRSKLISPWCAVLTGSMPTAAGWLALGGRHSSVNSRAACFNFDATSTAVQNLLDAGDEFDDPAWTNTTALVLSKRYLAPDKKHLADLIVNAGGSGSRVTQSFTATNASHVYSVYVRGFVGAACTILFYNSTTATSLANVALTFATGGFSNVVGTNTVLALDDQWYRVILPVNSGITVGNTLIAYVYAGTSSGSTADALFAWGARVDTGTDPLPFWPEAECPRMDFEFDAWLARQDVLRCITMTMQATGYDSSGAPYTKKIRAQISNMGYNAQEQDGLTNPHFQAIISKVPTYSVDLPGAFQGQGNISIGELVVRNPRNAKTNTQRIVQNLITGKSEDMTHAAYGLGGGATATATVITFPAAALAVVYQQPVTGATGVSGRIFCIRVKISTAAGTKNFRLRITQVGVVDNYTTDLTATTTPKVFYLWATLASTGGTAVTCGVVNDSTGAAGSINATQWQIEELTFAAKLMPGEYASIGILSSPWYGFGADGRRVFSYSNGNTGVSNVLTEANGTPLNKSPGGVRDDWLRYAWDRDPTIMRMGDKSWPYHDHRVILRARLGIPKAPSVSRIAFKLGDTLDVLNADVNPVLYTTGDSINQRKPELFGEVNMCEPVLIDSANLVFQISRRALAGDSTNAQTRGACYNNGIPILSSTLTISNVDTAADTIQFTTNHGLTVGWIFQYFTGTIAAVTGGALALNTDYFVVAVPANDKIQISRTLGGGAIDFTSNVTGNICQGFGFRVDAANGLVTLVNSPGGRLTYNGADLNGSTLAAPYSQMAFNSMALSQNYKDTTSFNNLDGAYSAVRAGLWVSNQKTTGLEAFNKYAAATFTWFCPVPDGRIQVGRINLPSATPSATFGESDILKDSMTILDVIRPIDMSKAEITYSPFFLTGGFLQMPATASPAIKMNKAFCAPYSYGATSIPLEDYPTLLDSDKNAKFETVLNAGATEFRDYLATFYKWKIGIFGVQTRLRAVTLTLGATIRLAHGRMGWEVYNTTNPASPEHGNTIDAQLAVVIGKSFDLKRPHPITLKLMRPIHANFPTSDIT